MYQRLAYLIMVSFFFISNCSPLFGQHTQVVKTAPSVIKKDIAFVVRKPARAKDISKRFHIASALFSKLNPGVHKRQLMYAGKQLLLPVWMKRVNTGRQAADFDITDYELATDSLDIYINEDFICLADIEKDTIRKKAITKEVRKIDSRIQTVNLFMDSIDEQGMRTLSNREIRKMPLERARRAGKFTIGTQIDSLNRIRKQLTDESSKIDLRVKDYEYVVENATYEAAHTRSRQGKDITIHDWADNPDKTKTIKQKK